MHTGTYTMPSDENTSDVRRWFAEAISGIWPVATGSVSLRTGPCIRKNCPACDAKSRLQIAGTSITTSAPPGSLLESSPGLLLASAEGPACAAGKGHSSYALYVRRGSRRLSIYVPQRLVPDVRRAIENGRLLQELINEAGVRYVSALKNEEPPTP